MGCEYVDIGKGMCRVKVRSKTKRARIGKVRGVRIAGERVIFPRWMTASIERMIRPERRQRPRPPEQLKMF